MIIFAGAIHAPAFFFMPTAVQMRTRLRNALDDVETAYRQGTFWQDYVLDLFLDAAQLSILRGCVVKMQFHAFQNLIRQATITGVLTPLPADYFAPLSATINASQFSSFTDAVDRPAALHVGAPSGIEDWKPLHHAVMIHGTNARARIGATPVTGRLFYVRRPTRVGPATNHVEMPDWVYDAVVHLAACGLQSKDDGTVTRSVKAVTQVLGRMQSVPGELFPALIQGVDK